MLVRADHGSGPVLCPPLHLEDMAFSWGWGGGKGLLSLQTSAWGGVAGGPGRALGVGF